MSGSVLVPAQSQFVTFVIACPFCQQEVPMPSIVITPVLAMSPGANRLSVRLGEIPSVPHDCVPR